MTSRSKKIKCISLFSGAGGMDLGFAEAGAEIIWANDFDKDSVSTYRKNIGDHAVLGDINQISSDVIPYAELLIGGPPCQGFSVAGKMDPNDPRSRLIWEFLRVLNDKKPLAFVMENVKSLAENQKFEKILNKFLRKVQEIGYLVEVRVLNSSEFDVPQLRERAIFIGVQKKLGFNPAELFPTPKKDKLMTVREVLSQLPEAGSSFNHIAPNAKIVPAKNPVLRKSPYAGMLFNGQGRPLELDRPAITLTASMGGNKTPFIDLKALKENSFPWVETYHEKLMNGHPPVKKIPDFLRRITVHEAALLQTFPKNFIFQGSQCSQFKQIGNAVPPKFAKHIAQSLLRRIQ